MQPSPERTSFCRDRPDPTTNPPGIREVNLKNWSDYWGKYQKKENKCKYCGTIIFDNERKCSSCGAPKELE
jgi:hypothetical protein